MSRALATGLLLLLGCGGSYAHSEEHVDAADEIEPADEADAADVMTAPAPPHKCLMKCPDISAPCVCPDQ